MDLKPSALSPSACIPQVPYTDLRDMLKTYGDAEVTVSVTMVSSASAMSDVEGKGVIGEDGALYSISVSLFFSLTTNCPV